MVTAAAPSPSTRNSHVTVCGSPQKLRTPRAAGKREGADVDDDDMRGLYARGGVA